MKFSLFSRFRVYFTNFKYILAFLLTGDSLLKFCKPFVITFMFTWTNVRGLAIFEIFIGIKVSRSHACFFIIPSMKGSHSYIFKSVFLC